MTPELITMLRNESSCRRDRSLIVCLDEIERLKAELKQHEVCEEPLGHPDSPMGMSFISDATKAILKDVLAPTIKLLERWKKELWVDDCQIFAEITRLKSIVGGKK